MTVCLVRKQKLFIAIKKREEFLKMNSMGLRIGSKSAIIIVQALNASANKWAQTERFIQRKGVRLLNETI